jgi:hypothetical protein
LEGLVTIEDRLERIEVLVTTMLREGREDRSKRQHEAGRWASRAEAAKHYGLSVDTIDAHARAGALRSKKLGPEPEERRDRLGRRVDRRRVLVWIEGAPKPAAEIAAAASEARSR